MLKSRADHRNKVIVFDSAAICCGETDASCQTLVPSDPSVSACIVTPSGDTIMGRGDKIVASSHFTVHTSSVWSVASMKEGRHLENEYISYFTSWPGGRRTQSGDLLCFPSLHHCSRLNLHAICSQLEPGIVVGLAPPPRRATGDFSLSLDLLLPLRQETMLANQNGTAMPVWAIHNLYPPCVSKYASSCCFGQQCNPTLH